MDFEYGCAITNKYSFLDENEVEDPSDLLAHVSESKVKQSKEIVSVKSTKSSSSGKQTSNTKLQQSNNSKKQPLQQQVDNSVKSGNKSSEDIKKQKPSHKQSGNTAFQQQTQPKEDKENNTNKTDRKISNNISGFKGDRRETNDVQRLPRRNTPRVDGGFSGQDRQPRRFKEFGNDNIQNEDGEISDNTGFKRDVGFTSTGGYRGARAQGFRNRRGNDSDRHREFDRHSGSEKTGIKHVDKKDGAGKGNWGTAEDELAAQDNLNETQAEQTENNWATRVDESEEAKKEDNNEENKEIHPNFMTLDEYKALRNEINKKNQFNIRQPGEGEDQSKWPKTYLLAKKKDEEENDEEEEENEDDIDDDYEVEEDKKKSLINQIQIRFYEPSSGRRGDRRGGERRGPRLVRPSQPESVASTQNDQEQTTDLPENKERINNRQRNTNQRGGQKKTNTRGFNHQKANVPRIEDEKDFPSLGK